MSASPKVMNSFHKFAIKIFITNKDIRRKYYGSTKHLTMTYEDIFSKEGTARTLSRINKLTPDTSPKWGKMNAAQMLAHLSVAYEMDLEDIHPAPNGFTRLILKLLVKKAVCGPKPYAKNIKTAPQFIIKGDRDFDKEKKRLTDYIQKVAAAGSATYEGRENQSFGPLTAAEWNTMYAKHLDHHLTQFGV